MDSTARRSLSLFRVRGVEIVIDYSWILIFLLVLWSLGAGYFPQHYPGHGWPRYLLVALVATLLFFASVLIHELSHAWMANSLGQDVRRITLFIFGGMAHLSREPRDPLSEAKIAGIGPLTSLALAALFWGVAKGLASLQAPPLWAAIFAYLCFINVALAIFNLLPGFPLDGGRLLRAYFWKRSGDLRAATARAADWGAGIALGLMALGALQIFGGTLIGGLWLIFIGMFLRGAADSGLQSVVIEQALRRAHVRDLMISEPLRISPDTSVATAIEDYFLRHGHGGFPVTSNGSVEGLLSLAQVRDCPPEARTHRSVGEIMRPLSTEIQIGPGADVSEALRRMVEGGTGRLLVMEGSRLQGLITRDGIARFVQLKSELHESD